jgi:hypothetical protein
MPFESPNARERPLTKGKQNVGLPLKKNETKNKERFLGGLVYGWMPFGSPNARERLLTKGKQNVGLPLKKN